MKKRIIDFSAKNPVFITALVCVLFYFLPFKPKPFGDGDFHFGTIQLIEFIKNGFHGEIMINKGFLTLFCYLIPYGLVYSFHNDALYLFSGVAFSCVFVCLSIFYLFKAFTILGFSNQSKAFTLLILCLFPIHVYYAMGIIGEIFAFFAVSVMIYFWVKINFSETSKTSDFVYLALAFVLLYGIKPTALPFLIAFGLYILFLSYTTKNKTIFLLTLTIIPLLILTEVKLYKNDNEFKKKVFRNQILWSRFELRDEPFNWLPQHGNDSFASNDYKNNLRKRYELDSICLTNKYDRTQYYIKWVKDDIVNHPFITLRQYFLKFFQSQSFIITPLMKSHKPVWFKYGIHIYINLINSILVIIGLITMYKLFKRKKWRFFIPILLYWGSALVYVFLFHSEQRYMFPFRPMLIFLFAYYIANRNLIIDNKSFAK